MRESYPHVPQVRKVKVLRPDRTFAFQCMPHEAAKLVSTECAIAETDIRGNFRGVVVLRAPGGDVERAIELARTVLMPNRTVRSSAGITRNKQQAGAPKWVQRPDMSGRGLTCKGAKTVHFRMGFYEAAGLL